MSDGARVVLGRRVADMSSDGCSPSSEPCQGMSGSNLYQISNNFQLVGQWLTYRRRPEIHRKNLTGITKGACESTSGGCCCGIIKDGQSSQVDQAMGCLLVPGDGKVMNRDHRRGSAETDRSGEVDRSGAHAERCREQHEK